MIVLELSKRHTVPDRRKKKKTKKKKLKLNTDNGIIHVVLPGTVVLPVLYPYSMHITYHDSTRVQKLQYHSVTLTCHDLPYCTYICVPAV